MREGDDLARLTKNFVTAYSLKKDCAKSIMESLEQLVSKRKNTKSYSQGSIEEQELNIPDDTLSQQAFMPHNQSFSSFQN